VESEGEKKMKTRNGFVSNSSSSSFVIPLSGLTAEHLYKIQNHREIGKKLGISYAESGPWSIEVDENAVKGSTWMDNFDMHEFMEKIGINMDNVKFGEY